MRDPDSIPVVLVVSVVMLLHTWDPGVPGSPQGQDKVRTRPLGQCHEVALLFEKGESSLLFMKRERVPDSGDLGKVICLEDP